SADLDNDGLPDVIAAGAGDGVFFWHNLGGRFESWKLGDGVAALIGQLSPQVVEVFDADNDGRLDIAFGDGDGVSVIGLDSSLESGTSDGGRRFTVDAGPTSVTALAAADLDGDGDLDLVAGGANGLTRLINEGGNQNGWLSVRLRGLATGSSKNNSFGLGSTLEVRAADAYQFREATGDVTHFGLGEVETADFLRVVWTNGVPQNRLSPNARQRVVEEQLLKGSCPFLYTWTGERFEFATDLLWGAPAGLPMGIGKWMPSDPEELVEIEQIAPRNGDYEIRITEELWEAAFFDYLRLWVVDHPNDVEAASTLKILPGSVIPEGVHGTRGLRDVATAWDARGRDVTERVRSRDGVYADGWERSRYQGVPAEPWSFTFDLGLDEVPPASIRLHLDGWIFPSDASLNIALDQGQHFPFFPPRLEVETENGWQVLADNIGFPAGKTKTMVVDTPALPPGVRRLRIVASQWLSWDRIAWAPTGTAVADHELVVQAKLGPSTADLRFRGFNRLYRTAPNAPHEFDYARVSTASPWLPFPGRYTRYGDVRELLTDPDDRSVVLAAGDEMVVVFDGANLPPLEPGWSRTLFLESHGWDKDADRNTLEPDQLEPLPFRDMATYGEPFPDTPFHRRYVEQWLTRVVEPAGRAETEVLSTAARHGR
ncbi:MAG: CRTAC1 family protein, partial [Acidobacteriota bacterium]|nr:CRTAC1 family protein [Acidobacteriota bacterium]